MSLGPNQTSVSKPHVRSPRPPPRRAAAHSCGESCRDTLGVERDCVRTEHPFQNGTRHGILANTSNGGNGTWRKKPIGPGARGEAHPGRATGDSRGPSEMPGLTEIVCVDEACVDDAVSIPPRAVERRLLYEAVQQRPERPVRESVVVGVHLASRERDRPEIGASPSTRAGTSAPPSHPTQAPPRTSIAGREPTRDLRPRAPTSGASYGKAIRERDNGEIRPSSAGGEGGVISLRSYRQEHR